MNALMAILLLSPVAALVAAAVVAVMRASDATINTAVILIAFGFAVVLAGVAARIVMEGKASILEGKASIRQAQFPAPSHRFDNRTQNIDARQQFAVVDADGRPVELPPGQHIAEVMR